MAYANITNILSAQKPAGIKKVYIRNASEKWQTLGQIRNGSLMVTPYTTNNTYQNNLHINSYTFEAKFEMLQTLTIELEALPNILTGISGVANDFLFYMTDVDSIPTSATVTAGWVIVTASQVRPTAKYVSDGNPSTDQFVEIVVRGTLLGSAVAAAVKASIDDGDFHLSSTASESFSNNAAGGGGTLFGYYLSTTPSDDVGVLANIRPNGFSSVALDNALSSGAETLTYFRNGKIVLDFVSEDDSLGRPNVYAIDVLVEHESTLTDAATLILMNSMNPINTNVVVTLLDGKVFTFNSKLGVATTFENVGDFDKLRILRFVHKGRILLSELAGVVA